MLMKLFSSKFATQIPIHLLFSLFTLVGFKICKKNGSVCIESLHDPTVPYVLKVNEAQDLIFEVGFLR